MRLLYLFVFAFIVFSNQSVSAATHLGVTERYVPGEVIVRLKPGLSAEVARGALFSGLMSEDGQTQIRSVLAVPGRSGLQRVRLEKAVSVADAVQALRENSAVEFAEPNYIVRAFDDGTPNDPLFGKQWNLKNTGQRDHAGGQTGTPGADIHVTPVWEKGIKGDSQVIVAVIDTGVDFTHPDLAANVYTNRGEIPNNGIDDDQNGYIDDVHGWNSRANNGDSMDDHGHGTHCAGVIGAVGDNALGIAGINRYVSILPVKFLSKDGEGATLDAINGIQYARKMHAKVMSNSWGGGEFSQALLEAIQDAQKDGILFVSAAGNEGVDINKDPHYPAAYALENTLTVAATDNRDRLGSFSNFGKSVQIAAPGVNILSTVLNGRYQSFSGTSMATPHIAGVAALLASARPEFTGAQIKQALIESADSFELPVGKEVSGGRVNASRAILGR